ncbi:MAG: hypothetical protein GW903_03500 [Alphaproteobacteria bacterium]|nr:hypothetical protein [Alphaproteobacteria bacterium]NCT05458.1 hypothetical protein [Alphaproteobacteria bacterium]
MRMERLFIFRGNKVKLFVTNIINFFFVILKSAFKFFTISWRFFIVLNIFTVTAWWLGWFGDECRYYGSIVERCFLFGKNIDTLLMTDMILTPFVLPLIGLIAGPFTIVVGAVVQAILATMFVWPAFILLRKLILFFTKKLEKT